MGDFNLALVIVAIVVVAIVFLVNVYLLVNYQHPDDVNQAYFPKFVVVFGLSIAAISILMLPADVANRQACRHAIYNGACNLTLPMKDLWLAVYVIDAILVFFVIPFAMFYYEGDQDKSIGKRVKSALWWVVSTAIVCALVLGILYVQLLNMKRKGGVRDYGIVVTMPSKVEVPNCNFTYYTGKTQWNTQPNIHKKDHGKWEAIDYWLVGKVDFTVRHLSSSTTSFPNSWVFNSGQQCIGNGVHQCSAYSASPSSEKTWTMRSTFPEYVVALATIVGSVLFSIFGGVGIACLPLGLIFSFIRRPKAVITRSQYIKEATELGKKAKELKKAAESLHQDERSGAKGRKHRKNVKEVEKELFQLEEDVKLLEEMYPQGEKAETTWALTVLGYLANLVFGILGLIVSVAWIAHIIIYLLINPPLSPFLNEVFIKLDDIWGLLGTAAFAFFCFYLLLAVIAGATMLGLRLVFITIHPMKWGATLMNSFLFNVGLILLCSISVIQFCSTAFAYYAQATAAQEIFGHTLESLRGIKYLYKDGEEKSLVAGSNCLHEVWLSPQE
ncbi:LIMR family protein at5g01460-like protein [Trifolium pratense]|uniref:LIMR family protein at5g01460-like protein n=3 Tax=Trifolium TaxID=3898 RepID=A0A2K3P759_TRIPR|nr:LIMR family protein at5g01460-like protein [Trifolium pratense]